MYADTRVVVYTTITKYMQIIINKMEPMLYYYGGTGGRVWFMIHVCLLAACFFRWLLFCFVGF